MSQKSGQTNPLQQSFEQLKRLVEVLPDARGVPLKVLDNKESSQHRHPSWELRLLCRDRDSGIELLEIVPPGTNHGNVTSAVYPCTVYWRVNSRRALCFMGKLTVRITGNEPLLESLIVHLELLNRLSRLPEKEELLSRHAPALYSELVKLLEKMALPPEGNPDKGKTFEQAVDFIVRHASYRTLKTEEVARFLGVSAGYLPVLFRKETGLTIKQFICRMRMMRALELLEEGKYPVSVVAQSTGWSSVNYFCTVFREQYGITPGEYQRICHDGTAERICPTAGIQYDNIEHRHAPRSRQNRKTPRKVKK